MYLCLLSRFNQNMKGVTCGTGTAYPCKHTNSPPVFSGIHVARSLVFCVIFCSSLSFFFWPLYCPSFFDFLLITPLISAHFSYGLQKNAAFSLDIQPDIPGYVFNTGTGDIDHVIKCLKCLSPASSINGFPCYYGLLVSHHCAGR